MDAEYRGALLVMFVAAMAIGLYYRLQARKSGETFDRRQEGVAVAIVLRLAGMGLWVTTVLYLLHPEMMRPVSVPLPAGVRWLGAVFGLAGVGLMVWTLSSLGKNLTDTVSTRREATLVTNGPYRFVRHPFYVTAAVLMLAAALLSANLAIAASGLLVMALLVARTRREEDKLIEKFGDAYRGYMQSTGRFVPRWRPRGA